MFHWTRCTRAALAAVAVALAAGCGGGDDDEDYVAPVTPKVTGAEGFWIGTGSTGYDVALAILDDGETWGVYARNGVIVGAVHGTSTAANGRLQGSAAQFNLAENSVTSRAFEGTYATQKDIQVWFGFDAFTGTYSAAYEQPASLAQLAGTYRGVGISAGAAQVAATLSVSATGVIASEPMQGCTVQGTAAPRTGGKNLFDVRLSFAGDACTLGHGSVATGVAYQENGRLLLIGLLPSQVRGFAFQGSK